MRRPQLGHKGELSRLSGGMPPKGADPTLRVNSNSRKRGAGLPIAVNQSGDDHPVHLALAGLRFRGCSGHRNLIAPCPLMTQSRHEQVLSGPQFAALVVRLKATDVT
jgi:hypothetical protein